MSPILSIHHSKKSLHGLSIECTIITQGMYFDTFMMLGACLQILYLPLQHLKIFPSILGIFYCFVPWKQILLQLLIKEWDNDSANCQFGMQNKGSGKLWWDLSLTQRNEYIHILHVVMMSLKFK